jgi:DUF971 family protein
MDILPTDLKLEDDGSLVIAFNDGQRRRYTVKELFDNCPAADAKEDRKADAERAASPFAIMPVEEAAERKIESVRPVGRYAYNIRFNHGSSAGIYSFEFLRTLGEEIS